MHVLEQLVDGIYVINLAHREDRWDHVRGQLARVGIMRYERFDAYGMANPPPARYTHGIEDFEMSGWWGNKFSHYGVIDLAYNAGFESVLVFEDDVVLHEHFNLFVGKALAQLAGHEWDWLQFGGNHRFTGKPNMFNSPIDGKLLTDSRHGITRVSRNLARIHKMMTAHAYVAKRSTYSFILDHAIRSSVSIDAFYCYEVHNRFKCYCVVPCMAKQMPGYNDIGCGYSDYSEYIGD